MPLQIDIRTKDGNKICLNCYVPVTSIGKVMIVAPTVGVTQSFYTPFSVFFMQWGFTVITFDYRGMGCSGPEQLKGFEASMHQWAVQDADAVILYVKNKYPNQEIIYAGHCIGGEIVGLAQASQYVCKLVLINSALSCKQLWQIKDRVRIAVIKTIARISNTRIGHFLASRLAVPVDIPKGVIQEWTSWCNNPNGLFDSFPDNNYRKLQVPLLAFSFSDDWHCPPRAVSELLGRFANAMISWHHIKPAEIGMKKIGHFGFFDDSMKSLLWMKLLKWMMADAASVV